MAALVIKNLPESLHRRLKARARRNHRSLTKEAIAILEAGASDPGVEPESADALDALAAAGKALMAQGLDLRDWAARSRDVWR
jgi:plasmid stability protein